MSIEEIEHMDSQRLSIINLRRSLLKLEEKIKTLEAEVKNRTDMTHEQDKLLKELHVMAEAIQKERNEWAAATLKLVEKL